MRAFLVAAVLAAMPVTAAVAQDQVAFDALARAEYGTAERELAPQVAAGERDPGVLLNLAAVYVQTGRSAEATGLYRMVQSEDNALLSPANGAPAWSHDIATRGMSLASR